jgi:hypothetical protein
MGRTHVKDHLVGYSIYSQCDDMAMDQLTLVPWFLQDRIIGFDPKSQSYQSSVFICWLFHPIICNLYPVV